jgi:hypothetical protein
VALIDLSIDRTARQKNRGVHEGRPGSFFSPLVEERQACRPLADQYMS